MARGRSADAVIGHPVVTRATGPPDSTHQVGLDHSNDRWCSTRALPTAEWGCGTRADRPGSADERTIWWMPDTTTKARPWKWTAVASQMRVMQRRLARTSRWRSQRSWAKRTGPRG